MTNTNGHTTDYPQSVVVRVSFNAEEAQEFGKYVEEHTIHKGKFIKKLVLDAIRGEKV